MNECRNCNESSRFVASFKQVKNNLTESETSLRGVLNKFKEVLQSLKQVHEVLKRVLKSF